MPSMVNASASGAVVSASPAEIPNDGTTSAISISILDSTGEPMAGIGAASIVVTSTGTGNTIVQPTGATDANGGISGASIASTVAEAKTITVTVGGLAMSDTPVVTVTSDAAPEVSAANSSLARSPATIDNDGVDACVVTLTVRDQFNAAMAGITAANISLASSRGATDTIAEVDTETDANGAFRFEVTSVTVGSPVFTATANAVFITQTATVSVSDGSNLYPNLPVGLTEVASFDGTVRESGGHAMGISWMTAWDRDPAQPDANLAVTADATNPLGSGSVLRFVYDQTYNPRCADASGTFPAEYSTLYIMTRIYFEDSFNTKFFYLGFPSIAGSNDGYSTREIDGRLRFINQVGGQGELIDTSEGAPDGNSTTPIVVGEWQSVEYVFEAESSPGAGDGTISVWVNGVASGSRTNAAWGDLMGSLEWYADNNSVTGTPAYRLGELYIAGSV